MLSPHLLCFGSPTPSEQVSQKLRLVAKSVTGATGAAFLLVTHATEQENETAQLVINVKAGVGTIARSAMVRGRNPERQRLEKQLKPKGSIFQKYRL